VACKIYDAVRADVPRNNCLPSLARMTMLLGMRDFYRHFEYIEHFVQAIEREA
jgi:hypothetical protein